MVNLRNSQSEELEFIKKQARLNAEGIRSINTKQQEILDKLNKLVVGHIAIQDSIEHSFNYTVSTVNNIHRIMKKGFIALGSVIAVLLLFIIILLFKVESLSGNSQIKDALISSYEQYFSQYGMELPELPEFPEIDLSH